MKTALLLVDIQNDYFAGGANPLENADNAALNAKRLLEKFRLDNAEIIHIQHLAQRADASFFIPGTEGCNIHQLVQPFENEKVIIKHFPNSFRETELPDYLQMRQINHLVICGMMTHMCIDATTRAAKDLGFSCTLIADACAAKELRFDNRFVKATDVHHSFVAALSYFYASVKTTGQFLME